jgi:glycosidase
MNRFLWVAKGDTRKLRVAAALQFTLAPPPIIYYGTEAGIRQQADARSSGWGGDAQARGLMLWGADQDADLLAYYRRLIALRRAHPAIRQGTRRTVHLDEAARTYAYTQTGEGLVGLLTVLNLGAEPRSVSVPLAAVGPPAAAPRDRLNDHPVELTGDGLRVTLSPYAAALIPLD